MNCSKHKVSRWLIIIAASGFAMNSFASADNPVIKKLDGGKGQLKVDSFIQVEDKFLDTSFTGNVDTPFYVKNIITLRINEDTNLYYAAAFTASVNVEIIYTKTGAVYDSTDTTLTITYDPAAGHTYDLKRSFVFDSAHRVKVRVKSVTATTAVLKVLVLENEIQAWPNYRFGCTTKALKNIVITEVGNGDTDHVSINWAVRTGADEYDLEWTYIDTADLASGKYGTPPDPTLVFDNNTTRITTTDTKYDLPLIFPDSGTLFVRARAVQIKPDGSRIAAKWSSDTLPGFGRYRYAGHQLNVNWQSSISFAEEGKLKTVVQYFDGSLRTRQTVTEDNATGKIVVAETLYDFQGRPVIQVLPAPTLDNLIHYSPNFNVQVNGAEYDKGLYDTLINASYYCSSSAPAMGTANGAAKYYSPDNGDVSGVHKYIPNAQGYVFTETEYTQDNTGRISRQGGVGSYFRLGTGRETKYYYGTADQGELDALFGTEAGEKSHYFKNMVRDANGQYSVSYVDMHGRTVATALAGENPASLDTLSSKKKDIITETIADANTNVTTGLMMQSKKSLLVPKRGAYTFNYDLSPETLKKEGCSTDTVCYDCLYDLEITITGDCNNQKLPGGKAFDTLISSFHINSVDTANNSIVEGFHLQFTDTLEEGNYEITKKLSVSQGALNYYRDTIFMKKNTCSTVQQFVDYQASIRPGGACVPDCHACYDSLGTINDFRTHFVQDAGIAYTDSAAYRDEIWTAYQGALAACKTLCDTATGDNDYIREAMLRDVSPPSGQYANLGNIDSFSVFYRVSGIPRYKTTTYRDDNGNPDYVYNDVTGEYLPPQSLDSTAFSQKFRASWAEALLPFHPEFCKLTELEKHAASLRWDNDFLKTDTYADALSKGYLNPTANTGTSPFNDYTAVPGNKDPLSAESGAFKTRIEDTMLHYMKVTAGGAVVSLWTLAAMTTRCGNDNTCMQNFITNGYGFDSLACDGNEDMAWRIFRGLYLNIKKYIIDSLVRNATSCAPHTNYSPAQLIATGHYPNFPNTADALDMGGLGYLLSTTDTTALKDSAAQAGAGLHFNSCTADTALWKQQLGACYSEAALTDSIIPKLLTVCQKGSDATHPLGAREISPDSSYAFRSFDDVISDYNRNNGVNTKDCNADLITFPQAYSQQAVYSSKPSISKPADCECTRINGLYQEWLTNATVSDTTFSAYLQRQYHTVISGDDLEQLISLCDSTATSCKYLTQAISLPPVLQCNSGDVCITCNQLNVLYQQFEATYDTVPVIVTAGDTTYDRINRLFANFMNNRFGFSKQPWEYLQFLQRCNNAGAPKCVSCDSLQTLVSKYFDTLTVSAGNETEMLTYVQSKLSNKGLDATLYQIKQALASCGNSWEKNISFAAGYYDGKPYIFQGSSYAKNLNIGPAGSNFTIECRANFKKVPSEFHQPLLYYIKTKNTNYLDIGHNDGCYAGPKGYYIYADTIASKRYLFAYFSDSTSYMLIRTVDTIVPSKWCHITITRRGDSVPDFKIYLNAQQSATVLVSGQNKLSNGNITPIFTNSGSDTSGQRGLLLGYNGYTGGMSGQFVFLKNLKLFKKALSDAEIIADYNNCDDAMGDTTSLKLWAKLNEGSGVPKDYGPDNVGGFWLQRQSSCQRVVADAPTNEQIAKSWTGNYGPAVSDSCLPHYAAALCNYPTADSLLLCGRSEPLFPPDTSQPITSCSDSSFFSLSIGTELYRVYHDSLKGSFDSSYIAKCLQAYKLESFTVTDTVREYHYTLYYYDQAGNLVKTVPPQGVEVIRRQGWLDSVKAYRAAGQVLEPAHTLITQHRYNTLNQVVAQQTPDAGKSTFYYDRLGRLALSQNAKQQPGDKFSYTQYDLLGRINEVGELENSDPMSTDISKDASDLADWLDDAAASRTQITRTMYDTAYHPLDTLMRARNLRNRIAWMALYDSAADIATLSHAAATFFSYDIHGNVDTLVQDFKKGSMQTYQNRFKKIVYRYDLISGKVNHVAYQPRQADAFYHRYTYDAENRLTDVETSADSITWEHEAFYKYYKHGPLGRAIIGDRQVQGIDYAYTLQGWLKGVNATLCRNANDMGSDGSATTVVARDAFGFVLYYYGDSDYTAINTTKNVFAPVLTSGFKPLYNGNIAAMGVNIDTFPEPYLYMYTYDQLNRLTAMKAASKKITVSTNLWTAATLNNYKENVSYDANGNILKYNRYNASAVMDSLVYSYNSGTNQLNHITDNVATFTTDIHNQGNNNYTYDAIGNLTRDTTEKIDSIYWNVYGKIRQISKHNGDVIKYTYDASGNRISQVVAPSGGGSQKETWYVRDASGNVMSVYTKGDAAINSGALSQTEVYLYGSSRLGVVKPNINVQTITPPPQQYLHTLNIYGYTISFARGKKFFELPNHLGNVMVTVSDKKKPLSDNGTTIKNYDADVVSAQDYYPFGMMEPGRNVSVANYRYGFNGKEQDSAINGSGVDYDYGARIYDARMGRFLSADPLASKYPYYSPYQFAGSNPIAANDVDGKEPDWITSKIIWWTIKTKLGLTNAGNNFSQNVQTIATQNSQGHFKESPKSGTIQEQVEAKTINTAKAKANAASAIATTAKVATIGAASPFLVAAAAPTLPELFAVAGTSNLNAVGSYLVQHTVSALLDAGSQKLITGKVDLVDVLTNYLPVKGVFQKSLLTAFQASVDYNIDDGLTYLGGQGLNEKKISDVVIDLYASSSVDKVFHNFNSQLEKAFAEKGLKGDKLTQAVGAVVQSEAEFLQGLLKVGIAETAKDKLNTDDKKKK